MRLPASDDNQRRQAGPIPLKGKALPKIARLKTRTPKAIERLNHSSNLTPHAPRLGLIADDLTGACDAGVQFAHRGFSTIVRLVRPWREREPADLAVLATNSRNDSPDLARAKVQEACHLLIQEQRAVIYKKIDSTLRGNIGPEIEAAMEACGCSLVAIVAPAFPAMGRTVDGGWLRVVGGAPTSAVHLPALLRQQGVENVTHFARELPLAGANVLIGQLEKVSAEVKTVIVIDAASQEDLALIAHAVAELRARPLLVGSAGLAAEVAKTLATKYQREAPATSEGAVSVGNPGSVVLILGSTNPVTVAQVDFLVANRPTTIVDRKSNRLTAMQQAIVERRHLIVSIDPLQESEQHLSEILTILADEAVRGVTLSGGDTADLACRALRASGIRLEREIAPGMPFGRFIGGAADQMAVATKAGGFGADDALLVITDFLATQERFLT